MFSKAYLVLALSLLVSLIAASCGSVPPGAEGEHIAVFSGFVNDETTGQSRNITLAVSGHSINDAGAQVIRTGSLSQRGSFSIGEMQGSRDNGQFDLIIPDLTNVNQFTVQGSTMGCPSDSRSACTEVLRIGLTFTDTNIIGATGSRSDALTWNIARTVVKGVESYNGNINSISGIVRISNFSVDLEGAARGDLDFRGSHFHLNGRISTQAATVMPKAAAVSLLIIGALHQKLRLQ